MGCRGRRGSGSNSIVGGPNLLTRNRRSPCDNVVTTVIAALRGDCGCPPVCDLAAGSISAGTTSASLGEVIFSNANGISFGMSGQVVTASFTGTSAGINLSIDGNTAGIPALVSSGTAVLFGGNNVTLAQIGNSITISANNEFAIALSISGNTSGVLALVSSGTGILLGGSNITLSQNGQSIEIIGQSGGSQSVQTQNCVDISLDGNTSGVLALISSGTAIFAGGNNITLSQNGNSVTIFGPSTNSFSQTVQTQNLFDLSLSGNTSGVLALISSGTAILMGGSNITLSQNGQSVEIIGASQSSFSQTVQTQNVVDLSLAGNTAGALALISSGTAIFAGGNNITLSQNGQSITISGANSAAAGGTINRFMPHEILALGVPQDKSLYFMWMTVPTRVEFDNVLSHMSLHINNPGGTLAASMSCYIGIYTNNVSTLSLQGSASTVFTFHDSSNGSSDTLDGWHHLPVPFTSTLTAGEYWVGLMSQTSNSGSAAWTASNMAVFNQSTTIFNGSFGAIAATNLSIPGWDFYTAATTAGGVPNSMAWSNIGSRYGGNHNLGPFIVFNSGSF